MLPLSGIRIVLLFSYSFSAECGEAYGARTRPLLSDEQCLLQLTSDVHHRIHADKISSAATAADERKDIHDKVVADNLRRIRLLEDKFASTQPLIVHRPRNFSTAPPAAASHDAAKEAELTSDGGLFKTIPDTWESGDTRQLVAYAAALILMDILVLARCQHNSWLFHIVCFAGMLLLSLTYSACVFSQRGEVYGRAWLFAYIMECVLSIDNLLMFLLVFKIYNLDTVDVRWALSLGLYGAGMLRVPVVVGLIRLLRLGAVVTISFGTILIVLGILALEGDKSADYLHSMSLVRVLKWCFGSRYREPWAPIDDCEDIQKESEDQGTSRNDNKTGMWQMSHWLMVVFLVAVVDIVFAMDSLTAKTGQIPNRYINFSSSLMAIYTMRAFFFIVGKNEQCFEFSGYGNCIILMYLGLQMIGVAWAQLSLGLSCVVMLGAFVACIVASCIKSACLPSEGSVDDETVSQAARSDGTSSEDAHEVQPGHFADSTGGASAKESDQKDSSCDDSLSGSSSSKKTSADTTSKERTDLKSGRPSTHRKPRETTSEALTIGQQIWVLNRATNQWLSSAIIDITDKGIKVHYDGLDDTCDEVVPVGSARIIREEEDVPDKWGILDTPLGLVVEKDRKSVV